jgi:hypothetical protein
MVRWWVLVHSLAASNEAVASVCTLLVQYRDLQGTMRPSQWESLYYLQRTSFRYIVQYGGQSELTATNAPVGRSVHWMGCVFSFGAGWGLSQSISFCC